MTPRRAAPIPITLCLLASVLAPCISGAQSTVFIADEVISVDAVGNPFTGPYVNSFARAVLYYTSNGQRAYNTEIIMGHKVWDLDAGFTTIYQGQVVSGIGYANSLADHLLGVWNHCYGAGMVVHVNSQNLHQSFASNVDCVEPPEPHPDPDPPDENCPILLDLDQDGFHLSGPDPAVSFDIDADGIKDQIAWTKQGEHEGFLCMDRNHNGVIDDGTELFGYATPLRNGKPAKVGYRALAELDSREAGGNRDGLVDTADLQFGELCVWVDSNRDGVSQPQEISNLPEAGVAALEYRYKVTRLADSYGNLFRYASTVQMRTPSGTLQSWPAFDVIFAEP